MADYGTGLYAWGNYGGIDALGDLDALGGVSSTVAVGATSASAQPVGSLSSTVSGS